MIQKCHDCVLTPNLQYIGNRALSNKLLYTKSISRWKESYVYLTAVQLGNQGTKLADLPKGTAGPGRPKMARLQLARRPSITGYGSMQAILADSAFWKVTYTHLHK
jgi:hypothetical protein